MLMLPHNGLIIANSEKARFRLLYVGKDIELLRALRKVLTKPEYHIVYCPHVDSAIDFLKGTPRYDLLMFELELRGLELAKLARSLSHREYVPIVMVTTNEIAGRLGTQSRNSRIDKWVSKQESAAVTKMLISLLEVGAQDDLLRRS
jgi:CheY-like chemotaxis protein